MEPRKVGAIFGPVVLVYFAVLAALGVYNIVAHPEILGALSPTWAVKFFVVQSQSWPSSPWARCSWPSPARKRFMPTWAISAARPSAISWLTLVYPCLMLNYLGQGALLLGNPAAVENPFYLMAPEWARLPLVVIATAATIIASQAVISGAFSVTHQAVQLGFLPRLKTLHTSAKAEGQIYIPAVNWTLLAFVILLVVTFRQSTNLASAYGIR